MILGDLGSPIIPHHNDSPVNGWNSWYGKKCGMQIKVVKLVHFVEPLISVFLQPSYCFSETMIY